MWIIGKNQPNQRTTMKNFVHFLFDCMIMNLILTTCIVIYSSNKYHLLHKLSYIKLFSNKTQKTGRKNNQNILIINFSWISFYFTYIGKNLISFVIYYLRWWMNTTVHQTPILCHVSSISNTFTSHWKLIL